MNALCSQKRGNFGIITNDIGKISRLLIRIGINHSIFNGLIIKEIILTRCFGKPDHTAAFKIQVAVCI